MEGRLEPGRRHPERRDVGVDRGAVRPPPARAGPKQAPIRARRAAVPIDRSPERLEGEEQATASVRVGLGREAAQDRRAVERLATEPQGAGRSPVAAIESCPGAGRDRVVVDEAAGAPRLRPRASVRARRARPGWRAWSRARVGPPRAARAGSGSAASAGPNARRILRYRRTTDAIEPPGGSAGAPRPRATTTSPKAASSSPYDRSTSVNPMLAEDTRRTPRAVTMRPCRSTSSAAPRPSPAPSTSSRPPRPAS